MTDLSEAWVRQLPHAQKETLLGFSRRSYVSRRLPVGFDRSLRLLDGVLGIVLRIGLIGAESGDGSNDLLGIFSAAECAFGEGPVALRLSNAGLRFAGPGHRGCQTGRMGLAFRHRELRKVGRGVNLRGQVFDGDEVRPIIFMVV